MNVQAQTWFIRFILQSWESVVKTFSYVTHNLISKGLWPALCFSPGDAGVMLYLVLIAVKMFCIMTISSSPMAALLLLCDAWRLKVLTMHQMSVKSGHISPFTHRGVWYLIIKCMYWWMNRAADDIHCPVLLSSVFRLFVRRWSRCTAQTGAVAGWRDAVEWPAWSKTTHRGPTSSEYLT